jgi:hypothetical protein
MDETLSIRNTPRKDNYVAGEESTMLTQKRVPDDRENNNMPERSNLVSSGLREASPRPLLAKVHDNSPSPSLAKVHDNSCSWHGTLD